MAPADNTGVDTEATINRALTLDIGKTNPMLVSSISEQEILGLTGYGLFNFDWNMNPFAATETVKSWQTSEDHLYDKVVLRDDLVWSDGQPITAHDVEFSYNVIMSSQVPIQAVRTGTDELLTVKAYDYQTLVYFHKKAASANVWNLNFPVIPKHIYEKTIAADPTLTESPEHIALEKQPVTGGAYELPAGTEATGSSSPAATRTTRTTASRCAISRTSSRFGSGLLRARRLRYWRSNRARLMNRSSAPSNGKPKRKMTISMPTTPK